MCRRELFRLSLAMMTFSWALALPTRAQDLTGGGAALPAPLYQQWFQEYQARTGVRVDYKAVGSEEGIREITAKAVGFGAADRPMTDQERRAAPAVVSLPMIAHAVVLVYNLPSLHRRLRLTGPLIAALYLGQVTRWNDPRIARVNPGVPLPDLPILAIHQSGVNATTATLTDYLCAVSPAWKDRMGGGIPLTWPVGLGGKGCVGVAGIVKQNVGGLGYMEYSNAVLNGVEYAAVQNARGRFIVPTVESAAAATESVSLPPDLCESIVNSPARTGYPVVAYTYLPVYQNGTDSDTNVRVKSLLTWMLTDGQREAAGLWFIPLPSRIRGQVLARVAGLRN